MLGELQNIKAEREEAALKELYAKYAPLAAINDAWFQTIIKRGSKLAINAGTFEQPWKIVNGEVQVFGTLDLEGVAPYMGK